MRTGRFIQSSSWAPVVAASSAVMRTATTAVSFASTAESCVQAAQVPATLRLTSGATLVRRATNRASSPLRAGGKTVAVTAGFEPREPKAQHGGGAVADDGVRPTAAFEGQGGAKPAPQLAEVHVAIDVLQYYDLAKPIPVVIKTLGKRTFEAEVPGLNISTTGSSLPGALLAIKEQIVALLERYRGKKILNPEQQRLLAALEQYVSGPRRNWYPR
jgi:hypothetical protein